MPEFWLTPQFVKIRPRLLLCRFSGRLQSHICEPTNGRFGKMAQEPGAMEMHQGEIILLRVQLLLILLQILPIFLHLLVRVYRMMIMILCVFRCVMFVEFPTLGFDFWLTRCQVQFLQLQVQPPYVNRVH